MTPSWRKPVGTLLIVAGLAIYAGAVMAASPWIGRLAWPVQTVVYLVLGIVWVFPVRPALSWMELGVWRR